MVWVECGGGFWVVMPSHRGIRDGCPTGFVVRSVGLGLGGQSRVCLDGWPADSLPRRCGGASVRAITH